MNTIIHDERLSRVMLAFVKELNSLSNVDPDNLTYIPLKGGGSAATLYRFDIGPRSYVPSALYH